jgi:hypothetical protein
MFSYNAEQLARPCPSRLAGLATYPTYPLKRNERLPLNVCRGLSLSLSLSLSLARARGLIMEVGNRGAARSFFPVRGSRRPVDLKRTERRR